MTQLAQFKANNVSSIDPPSLYTAQLEARLGARVAHKLQTTFIRAAARTPMEPIELWTAKAAVLWPDASIHAAFSRLSTSSAPALSGPGAAYAIALVLLVIGLSP